MCLIHKETAVFRQFFCEFETYNYLLFDKDIWKPVYTLTDKASKLKADQYESGAGWPPVMFESLM